MGLCAGFAVADFKPICWGKIGLVYHPSFIMHIVFVNPTNCVSPCCRHSFLSRLLSFAHTDTQKQAKTKDIAIVRIKYSYKMPTTVSTQTKEPLFTQKAMAMKQPEEDHMVENKTKQETIMLLHGTTKTLFCFSLALTHTYRLWSVAHQFEPEEWV